MGRIDIDIHHHFLPPAYVEALGRQGVDTSALPEWSPESSLGFMDARGIAKAVVSISSPGIRDPELARAANEQAASLVAHDPGRFGAFAALPLPDLDASIREVAHALDELELDGVILFSNVDGQYLGEPELDPLMAELDARSATVFVHANDRPDVGQNGARDPFVEYPTDVARAYGRLVSNHAFDRFPRIRFILANAGGVVPYLAERIGKPYYLNGKRLRWGRIISDLVRKRNGGLELARGIYYDTADASSPYVMRALERLVDPSHVLFGSSFPWAAEPTVPTTLEQGPSEATCSSRR